MGNIRADTNGIRISFERAPIHLIEVDFYWISTKSNPTKTNPVKVSAVKFSGHGKIGVDLCWHTRQEFCDISSKYKDELTSWQRSNEVKSYIKKQRTINSKKQNSDPVIFDKVNWRNKSKKEIKAQSGLSHVMSIMLKEEKINPLL